MRDLCAELTEEERLALLELAEAELGAVFRKMLDLEVRAKERAHLVIRSEHMRFAVEHELH